MEYTLLIGAVFLAITNNVLLHITKSKGYAVYNKQDKNVAVYWF